MQNRAKSRSLFLWLLTACLALSTALTGTSAMAAPGPGQSFLFLQPGFTQAIYGVAVMATGAGMAGPAVAPNGDPYTATDRGVVKLDANTGAPLLGPFGGPGLSTGIAVDPQTGNLVFQSG